ncbi:MAG: hypothetical protein IPK26_07240 [Planctomycetes bacterium]|nr:hypothetical protein [Planctomycetota bacterium]
MQAVRVLELDTGTVVVLGCPGGKVRVITPGTFRTSEAAPHGIGSMASLPNDLGHGGCALAAQVEGTGGAQVVRVWFGTAYGHAPRPANYSTGSLADSEVMCGQVHTCTWSPSGGFSGTTTVALQPGSSFGSGYVVTGLAVADLLPSSVHAGDELVVTTLSGDVLILDPGLGSGSLIFRTHVVGAAGCYNAVLVEDTDGDGAKELYLGGSRGLWRFVTPVE